MRISGNAGINVGFHLTPFPRFCKTFLAFIYLLFKSGFTFLHSSCKSFSHFHPPRFPLQVSAARSPFLVTAPCWRANPKCSQQLWALQLCILISWHFPHLLKCFPCVSKLGKKYLFSFLLPSCLRCLCWQGWVWSLPSAERSGRSQHDLCLFTAARCSRPRPVKLSESIERLSSIWWALDQDLILCKHFTANHFKMLWW